MNTVWTVLMLLSLCVLIVCAPHLILDTMFASAKSTVELCVGLVAIYAVWLGILEILEATGLAKKLADFLKPAIKKLFKTNDETAIKYIALNMSANILGLGNAATPSGIKAIKQLDKKNGKATFAMLMLIVVNATSIQLFPTTVIGLRASAGSANAGDIMLPTLLATICTAVVGICLMLIIKKFVKGIDE